MAKQTKTPTAPNVGDLIAMVSQGMAHFCPRCEEARHMGKPAGAKCTSVNIQ